jgi:hypothetical protein
MLSRHGIKRHRIARFVAGHDCFSVRDEGATTADKYAALGWELERADVDRINGAAEILVRLGDVENGIANRVVISSRCGKLIECLPALAHDDACPERVKKWDTSEDGEGGDDPYDAFRYGVMAASSRAGGAWSF